ncbi:MAG: hypothetical protein ACI83W_001683 [Marinoscillum sp.]|jgi:hypothetical protein
MRNVLLIQLITFTLMFSIVAEITAFLHAEATIVLESDSDNEEENEEHKLKEYTCLFDMAMPPMQTKSTEHFGELVFFWSSPILDNLTPPPKFV